MTKFRTNIRINFPTHIGHNIGHKPTPKSCPTSCPNSCPKFCPNICPTFRPTYCPNMCPKFCPNICPKFVRIFVPNFVPNLIRIFVPNSVRNFVRIIVPHFVPNFFNLKTDRRSVELQDGCRSKQQHSAIILRHPISKPTQGRSKFQIRVGTYYSCLEPASLRSQLPSTSDFPISWSFALCLLLQIRSISNAIVDSSLEIS